MLCPMKISFKSKDDITLFSDDGKLQKFVTNRAAF